MTSTSYNIIEVLEKLRSNKSINDTIATLTFINSDVGRMNLLKTMNSTQYLELCKLLVDFVVNGDESKKNKDLSKVDEKAEQILHKLLKDVKNEFGFFEIISKIDKSKRLKIFQFLKTLDDAVLLRISEDSFVVKYLDDCMQAISPETMEWLSPSTCIDSIQLLLEAEEKSSTSMEDQLIINSLNYLGRIYEVAVNNPSFKIQKFHLLIFEKVILLTYMGHKKQRTPALQLMNRALRSDFEDFIREKHENALASYKTSLQNHYCTRMLSLVKAKQSDWCYLWCFSLEIVGTDLYHGADLINNLLLVEEKAFKSADMTIRHQAFIAWKSLINIFASNPTHFIVPRRIKLLCIPLISKNSKTEIIAVTKLQTWWHLVVKLYPYIETFNNQVIFQFLNFCFGPLGETPLLSTKCDVASPGKRFLKARIYAVDALLQLLVADEKERREVSLVLDQKIPRAVTNNLFKGNYKSFIHSVGEAVLIISDLEGQSEEKRIRLNNVLWLSLMNYIQHASTDLKIKINKELILVIGEIINHLDDSSLISNLLLNVIFPELIKVTECIVVHRDTTMIDLLRKILSPKLLTKIEKKHWSDIKLLVCHEIKPDNVKAYNPNVLSLLKALINQMQSAIECKVNNCFIAELWCTLAESIAKYIADNQQMNEGTAAAHNFETILALIYFPIKNICWNNSEQMLKIVKIWRDLYKEFNMQADLITTVKFNEILHNVSETMENCLLQNNKCYSFISYCFSILMSTIHYGELLKQEIVPPIVILLRDVTSTALADMSNIPEIECSLKAISSLLITVYGLNQDKVLVYLNIVSSTVQNLLKVEAAESIQKEIANTWETIVLILRGLTTLLTYDFLFSYREAIICGLCHANTEIASETSSLLEIKKDIDEKSKGLLESIENEAKKTMSTKKAVREPKNEIFNKTPKPMKLVGSFFGRPLSSSKTVSSKKDKAKKIVTLPPEPDSQEYVVINTDVKVNVNLLTEHQKECFKQHKDDIPAMYNELSQSGSCNTQELEEWFKDKGANANLQTKTIVSVDNDANKENKNDSTADVSSTDRIPKLNQLSKAAQSDTDKVNDIQVIDKKSPVDELSPQGIDSDTDKYDENNQVPETVAKKLNFESREEFPDENDHVNDSKHNLRGSKRRGRSINNVNSRSHRTKSEENVEFQSSEYPQLQLSRVRTRSSKLTDKVSVELEDAGRGLKRKAVDGESDDDIVTKRRRHTVIPSSNDITNESQNYLTKIGNELDGTTSASTDLNLPERTKKEISRLKIDMVFNSKMTRKLRSKPSDDFIYEPTVKRHSMDSKTARQKGIRIERDGPSSEQSHELLKRRMKRDRKNIHEIKCKPNELQKSETVIIKNNEDYKESTDSERESDKSLSGKDEEDEKLNDDLKNGIGISSSPINTSTDKQEDDVIESSQESCLIRSSLKRNDKKLIMTNDKNDISQLPSIRKDLQHSSLVVTTKSSPSQNTKPHDSKESLSVEASVINPLETKKLSCNESKLSSTIFTYSSPKTKRMSKFKTYPSHGRAAHMLDLVTKQAIGEKNKPGKNVAEGEEEKSEQEMNKEINSAKESDAPGGKKDYLGLFKESERVSSPCGHRQEKIFSNMKSGDNSSPPPKLFSNLKNDGEKISPKMEKSVKELIKLNDHDYTEIKDVDTSVSFEKDELPILEWSSANPPSLTASPSASILKRQRQALIESDIDTTPQKRKRVSFADPPVSKQMGYEIIAEMSPLKSKIGTSYSFPGRKATPYRSRQSKLRTIEIPADKQNSLSNETHDQEDNDESFSNISVILEDQFKDIEESIVDPMDIDFSFSDNHLHEVNGLSSTKHQNELNDSVENNKDASMEESATQQDVFHEDDNMNNVEEMVHDVSNAKDKNDSTITRIINGSIDDEKSDTLEDTVDIQNVSNLTANSDELFDSKPIRTNSQIAANNALAECDTLPLTDSIFSSQGSIQNAPVSSQSKSVNTKDYICPELLGCETSIDTIIGSLVNPLWLKDLSKYFNSKHINTVGDLARLTEQEVAQIPINKSSKVSYVKKTLQEFSRSLHLSQKNRNFKNNLAIVNETKESESFNDSVGISPLIPSVEPSDNLNITEVLTNQTTQQTPEDKVSGSYGSIILDTTISPPKKTSTVLINQIQESPVRKVSIGVSTDSSLFTNTQAVGTQATLEELLDELDGNLVLQNAIKRSSLQSLLKEYKLKMKGTDEELKKNIIKILGISMSPETGLKNACHNYGLIKVLDRLSTIFNDDKQFISKVLNIYRPKITAKDCLDILKLDDIKKEFCKKCSSVELCDMIAKVLAKEENEAKTTVLTNTSCLNAMLKRMPIQSVIDTTIANDELIPSSAVLDVALQNNSLDTILQAVEMKLPDVRQKALEKYLTPKYVVSHVKDKKIPKKELLDIYEAISTQLTADELIDLNAEALKKKFQLCRTDDKNE